MNLLNTLLWTSSLSLAIIGILFGVIASINSAKANKKIQDLISTSFVAEESQKFLYDNLKNLITFNKKTIRALNSNITYSDYSLAATHTRLHLLSKSTIDILKDTEFREITLNYLETKNTLDNKFTSIIDVNLLSTNKVLSSKTQKELKNYHNQVIIAATNIIKSYTSTISHTSEVNIKK